MLYLGTWKLNIFNIIDSQFSCYRNNLDLRSTKPKYTLRNLKEGFQKSHTKFVLAPADKVANNVVVV